MITLTHENVLAALEEIIGEAGEGYAYRSPFQDLGLGTGKCVYVHNSEPSCLVGKVLHKLGVPVERLAEADLYGGGGGTPAYELLYQLQHEEVVEVINHSGVVDFLGRIQNRQDAGRTWRFSVDSAVREYNKPY